MNVGKLLRLKGSIEAANAVEIRVGGEALAASYPRLRAEVRAAIGDDLVEEFDRLFPERLQSDGQPWGRQAAEAAGYFAQMTGWIGGMIEGALLDQRIRAEAEAKVAAEGKRIGFE